MNVLKKYKIIYNKQKGRRTQSAAFIFDIVKSEKQINDTRMVSPNASTILLITVQLLGFAVIFNYPQSVIMLVQA